MDQGHDEDSAYAICNSSLKSGFLYKKLMEGADAPTAPKRILLLKDGDIDWADLEDVQLDAKSAADIIAAFEEHGDQLPIDYHHASMQVEDEKQGEAPAAGWITHLEYVEGEGLYADVEWTDKAKAQIESKEFKYHSPVILTDKKTHKIAELHSVALTNRPRTRDQVELLKQAADRSFAESLIMKTKTVKKKGDKAPETDPELKSEKAQADQTMLTSDDEAALSMLSDSLMALGVDVPADASLADMLTLAAEQLDAYAQTQGGEDANPDAQAAAEEAAKIVKTLELSGGVKGLTAEVAKLKIKADKHDELAKQVKTLLAERKTERVEALLAEQVQANRLNPHNDKQMQYAREIASRGEQEFREFCETLTPYAEPGQIVDPDDATGGGKDAREKLIRKACKEYDADSSVAFGANKRGWTEACLRDEGMSDTLTAKELELVG